MPATDRRGMSLFHFPGRRAVLAAAAVAGVLAGAAPASASLNVLRPSPTDPITFYGNGGYSTDGIGEADGGSLRADVPAGSTVKRAYLYGSYEYYPAGQPSLTTFERTVSFDGAAVALTEVSKTDTANDTFYAARADVTAAVAAKVGSGGGITSFPASGPPGRPLHGLALVVIYENPNSPRESIAILDGFAEQTGDNAKLTYSVPLNTHTTGFRATMALGIGWSAQGSMNDHACFGGQASTVDVNATRMASCAGNADDSPNSLITVGGVGDSTTNPVDPYNDFDANGDDDELYDLTPFLSDGQTELNIDTTNASQDDNIFLAVIEITARASAATNGQTPPPPPALPATSNLTSTGVGTAVQHQSAPVPADGSVHLVSGGSEVSSITIPQQGTYAVDPATGALTFTPVLGFTGTATGVTYKIADDYGQTATATYTATVTPPAAPAPAPLTTSGAPGGTQSETIAVPVGGRVRLLDADGQETTTVMILDEGTYVLDPATGVVTFTPVAGFTGSARAVRYRVTDAYGQATEATYAARVAAPGATTTTTTTTTGTTPPAAAPPAAKPVAKTCASRRAMTINWRIDGHPRVSAIVVTINGKRYAALKATARRVTVDLRGMTAPAVKVVVTAKVRGGKALSTTRTYKPCTAKQDGKGLATLRLR